MSWSPVIRAKGRSTRLQDGMKIYRMNKITFAVLTVVSLLGLSAISGFTSALAAEQYTPQQYARDRGLKNPRIIAPGRLAIDGTRMICGKRSTIYDPTLDDFGGAYNGFIILNPRLLKRLPKQVKLWIYSHECAHQFRGPDEATADCFAIKRGIRRGWLNHTGMGQICKFIWSAPASNMHPPGPERCKRMKACFASVKK